MHIMYVYIVCGLAWIVAFVLSFNAYMGHHTDHFPLPKLLFRCPYGH